MSYKKNSQMNSSDIIYGYASPSSHRGHCQKRCLLVPPFTRPDMNETQLESSAYKAFCVKDSVSWVHSGLVLGGIADQAFFGGKSDI